MNRLILFLLACLILFQPFSYVSAQQEVPEISPTKSAGELVRSEAALRTLVSAYQREDVNRFMDMVSYQLYGEYGAYPDLRDAVQAVFDQYDAIALNFNVDKSLREAQQVVITIRWVMSRVDTYSGLLENNEGYTDLVFVNDEEEGTKLVDITGDRIW
ncbi:MAG: hypothetical protein ABIH01_00605 [Candidatus Omnitrophota bacterium]